MLRRALAVMTAAGGAAVLWGTVVERRWYALRHVTVPVLRPSARRPLRLLHISDLHHLPAARHRLDFVRDCGATEPDVVAVTGDLLEADAAIDPVVETLAEVVAGRVGLAVLGAHDFYASRFKHPFEYFTRPEYRRFAKPLDTDRLRSGLQSAGYTMVDNDRTTVASPAGSLDVAGLGDAHVDFDDAEAVDWSPPHPGIALRLGLAHAPYRRVLDSFDEHGFDLVVAGHTHGGQVRLPVVGALTNNTDLPLNQSRGLSRYGGRLWLHVSAGLGHSRYAPFRFAARPEATVLDLVPAAT